MASATYTRRPLYTVKLSRGREVEDASRALARLEVDVVVAGDVGDEVRLRFMERVAEAAGAKLMEPLWGVDAEELLVREVESGIRAIVTSVDPRRVPERWLCHVIDGGSVEGLVGDARAHGFSPIGEGGEYHTLVVEAPIMDGRLSYTYRGRVELDDHIVALVEAS